MHIDSMTNKEYAMNRKGPILSMILVLVVAVTAFAGSYDKHHGGSAAVDDGKDIIETAASSDFNTLILAVKSAGLVGTLRGEGPFTVFAPTDEAFAKLPPGTLEDLLKPENRAKLQAILTYHVVPGKVMASDVVGLDSAKTVNGQSLRVHTFGNTVMVDDAKVIKADIDCNNGVIHVIDSVVLPG